MPDIDQNQNETETHADVARPMRGHGYDPVNCECPRHYHRCDCARCDICACAGADACGGCGVWAKPAHGRTLSIAADRRVSQDEAVWEAERAGAAFPDIESLGERLDEIDESQKPPAVHPTRLAGKTHAGEYAVSVGGMGDAPDEPPNYHELPLLYAADLPRINGVDPADIRYAADAPAPVGAPRNPLAYDIVSVRVGDFIDAVAVQVAEAGGVGAAAPVREVLTCGYCFHNSDSADADIVRLEGGGAICRDLDQCAANERNDFEAMVNDKAFMDEYSLYGSCPACGAMQFAGKLILGEDGRCVDEHECARRAEELRADTQYQGDRRGAPGEFCPPNDAITL